MSADLMAPAIGLMGMGGNRRTRGPPGTALAVERHPMTALQQARGDNGDDEAGGSALGVQSPDFPLGSAVLGAERPTAHTVELLRAEKALLERKVRDLQARTIELQRKTDAKSRFLEVVAHDLRSPLAAIVHALAELAKVAVVARDPHSQRLVQLMRESGRRMLRFTDDLNDLAAIQSGRFLVRCECVDLADVLRYASDVSVANAMARGRAIEVTVETPNRPTWVHADEDQLAQALINLLENVEPHALEGIRLNGMARASDIEITIQWACEESPRSAIGSRDL